MSEFEELISKLLEKGKIEIRVFQQNHSINIEIEDNAGIYEEPENDSGLGMNIVDKRIKNLAGNEFGLTIKCDKNIKTIASIKLPLDGIE